MLKRPLRSGSWWERKSMGKDWRFSPRMVFQVTREWWWGEMGWRGGRWHHLVQGPGCPDGRQKWWREILREWGQGYRLYRRLAYRQRRGRWGKCSGQSFLRGQRLVRIKVGEIVSQWWPNIFWSLGRTQADPQPQLGSRFERGCRLLFARRSV